MEWISSGTHQRRQARGNSSPRCEGLFQGQRNAIRAFASRRVRALAGLRRYIFVSRRFDSTIGQMNYRNACPQFIQPETRLDARH